MRLPVLMILIAALAGCASADPWKVTTGLPASPSEPFEGEDLTDGDGDGSGGLLDPDLGARPLHLDECVAIALERNPRTSASWEELRSAAARHGRSRAEALPTIGLSSRASRGETVLLDRPEQPGILTRYEGVAGVRWLLFDGGGRAARTDAAAAEVLASGFRHNTVLQEVVLATKQAYYSLLAARSFDRLAQESVGQREVQLRVAEARHRAGAAARSDVLRARTELADAELAAVRARNAVRRAEGRLASSMGVRVSTRLPIVEPPAPDPNQDLTDAEALLEAAGRNRPELRTALARTRIQEAGVRQARARAWPAVSLEGNAGRVDRTFPPGLTTWGVGLALDLPLFTGFDRTYHVQASRADLARAVAEARASLQGIELEVWTAFTRVVEAAESIEAARRLVASAEESVRVAEGEYRSGTGTITGLIDTQTARTSAGHRLIQSRLDWHSAMAQLERATGRSLALSAPAHAASGDHP